MTRRRAGLTASLTATLLLLASGSGVHACSCAPPPPPLVALERAAAVFLGDVVSVEDLRGTGRYGREVTLEVVEAWKGIDTPTVVVTTGYGGGDCGFTFRQGEVYLVYAYGGAEELGTNICTRTRALRSADADLGELGPPNYPPDGRLPQFTLIVVVGLAAVALLATLAIALRRVLRSRRVAREPGSRG